MLKIIRPVFRSASTFRVGDSITIDREITKEDLKVFGEVTGDFNPVHFPLEGDKKGVVHGALLNGIVSGVIGTKIPGPGTLVVSQTLNFPDKCFVGEIVSVRVILTEVRKIMRVKFVCEVKGTGRVVMDGEARLIKK